MSNATQSPLPSADHPDVAARLREALLAASFTADGLLDLLGAPAYAALARSETVPALRATRGDTPLETLIRLFLLQQPVPYARVEDVLPVHACVESGWLTRAGVDDIAATVDVRPFGGPDGEDWFIVSDLGCAVGGAGGIGSSAEGVVLGVGGASTTLAGITVRTPVSTALDLGTGSGIQALHAARHATRVTATDLNPRALHITALTLALSGAPAADLREGSLFEPVRDDERFDLIVSNPPFVISPGARLTYRDGGMGGDDLCRSLVQGAGERLTEGGFAQFLANWQHVEGEDWQDRLRSWVPRGCDAWIVQREVQDITQYAELWLRDAGDHQGDPAEYRARYDAWLDEFEARKVKAVGFGWITLRRTASDEPTITVEEWPHPVEQPLGDTVRAHFEQIDYPPRTRRRGPARGALQAGRGGRAGAGRAARRRGPRTRGAAPEPRHAPRDQGGHHRGGVRRSVRRIAERGPDPGRHRPARRRGPGPAARPYALADPVARGAGVPGTSLSARTGRHPSLPMSPTARRTTVVNRSRGLRKSRERGLREAV
ncbi:methylase of polypeptide subunit release factors [Streptomyces phaeoluteigriseus]